jgi:hypothetical protein
MATIISRVSYCPYCAAEKRPHKGSLFLVHGSYRDGYYVREAMRSGISGYVPHLFILKQVTPTLTVLVDRVCGMYCCGVEHRKNEKGVYVYGVVPTKWEEIEMPIKDWNGLVNFKRDAQYQL